MRGVLDCDYLHWPPISQILWILALAGWLGFPTRITIRKSPCHQ